MFPPILISRKRASYILKVWGNAQLFPIHWCYRGHSNAFTSNSFQGVTFEFNNSPLVFNIILIKLGVLLLLKINK